MSIAPAKLPKTLPEPLFWGPDGRYRPPVENGELPAELPGHLELPEDNGEIVENFRETPQSALLDSVITPILERLHPEYDFALGHDCGIYWRLADPPRRGVICPDWLYVPGVPPVLGRDFRRSYVLWKENVRPAVMIEYASEDGSLERDQTPYEGKFWVYENAVQGLYYAIFVVATGELEVFRLMNGHYQQVQPDPHSHYPIEPFGVALGVWHGFYLNETAPWLRWYDLEGNLMPLDAERLAEASRRLEQEHLRADEERLRADEEHRRADEEMRLREEEARRAEEQTRRAEEQTRRAEEQTRRAEEQTRRAEEQTRRAEEQTRRAEEQTRRAEELAAKLRELGIDPDKLGA